jgi:hypothetical protein
LAYFRAHRRANSLANTRAYTPTDSGGGDEWPFERADLPAFGAAHDYSFGRANGGTHFSTYLRALLRALCSAFKGA